MIWYPFMSGFCTAYALVDYSRSNWAGLVIDLIFAAATLYWSYRTLRTIR